MSALFSFVLLWNPVKLYTTLETWNYKLPLLFFFSLLFSTHDENLIRNSPNVTLKQNCTILNIFCTFISFTLFFTFHLLLLLFHVSFLYSWFFGFDPQINYPVFSTFVKNQVKIDEGKLEISGEFDGGGLLFCYFVVFTSIADFIPSFKINLFLKKFWSEEKRSWFLLWSCSMLYLRTCKIWEREKRREENLKSEFKEGLLKKRRLFLEKLTCVPNLENTRTEKKRKCAEFSQAALKMPCFSLCLCL